MQKKPILYDLVALVFPRVIGYAYAEGRAPYEAGYQSGYGKAKQDIVRSLAANIDTWYSLSSSSNENYEWHEIIIPVEPEATDAD